MPGAKKIIASWTDLVSVMNILSIGIIMVNIFVYLIMV
jgi:hypothetical protein